MNTLAAYLEFARIGFVNILAFRLRYYTGIITYLFNVCVYYFIWTAVWAGRADRCGLQSAQMLTYVWVGWIIRSFYWNTIDQEMAYEVIEGKIAMDLIKPVSVLGMWLARAAGESAFRMILLTLPTATSSRWFFPCSGRRRREFRVVSDRGAREFRLMGGINFLIGTCGSRCTRFWP